MENENYYCPLNSFCADARNFPEDKNPNLTCKNNFKIEKDSFDTKVIPDDPCGKLEQAYAQLSANLFLPQKMTAAEEFLHLQNSEAKVSNVKALSKDSLLGEEQWPEFVSNASTNIDFSRTMSFNKLQPNSAEDESFQMRSGPQQKPLFDFDTGKNAPHGIPFDSLSKYSLFAAKNGLFSQKPSLTAVFEVFLSQNLSENELLLQYSNRKLNLSLKTDQLVFLRSLTASIYSAVPPFDEDFWLDVCSPSAEDIAELASVFGIHPLTTEDLQDPDFERREKTEVYENYQFISFKALVLGDKRRTVARSIPGGNSCHEVAYISIMHFGRFVITVHALPIDTTMRRTLQRLRHSRLPSADPLLAADWTVYALLDAAIDDFNPRVVAVEAEVDEIEEGIFQRFGCGLRTPARTSANGVTDTCLLTPHDLQAQEAAPQSDEFLLQKLASVKRRVTLLSRLLAPKAQLLRDLIARSRLRDNESFVDLYYRDALDHVLHMKQRLDSYVESLERSHGNYVSQVNIELSHASNRLNDIMRKMAGAAFVLMPLNLIASIWGMNVRLPGSNSMNDATPESSVQADGFTAFYVILALMAATVVVMYAIGRRYRLL